MTKLDNNDTQAAAAAAAAAAAKIIAEATKQAQAVIASATLTAAELVARSKDSQTEVLTNALRDVFGENERAQKFIDVSKIPLICKSIIDMHENIDKINSNITWIVRIVIGAVVAALMGLIFIK